MNDAFKGYQKKYDEFENSIVLDSSLTNEELISLLYYILSESSHAIKAIINGVSNRRDLINWCKKFLNEE